MNNFAVTMLLYGFTHESLYHCYMIWYTQYTTVCCPRLASAFLNLYAGNTEHSFEIMFKNSVVRLSNTKDETTLLLSLLSNSHATYQQSIVADIYWYQTVTQGNQT